MRRVAVVVAMLVLAMAAVSMVPGRLPGPGSDARDPGRRTAAGQRAAATTADVARDESGPAGAQEQPRLVPLQRTAWLRDHGYLDNGYWHYDDSALHAMSRSGHEPAILELARRYARRDPEQALGPGWRATLLGNAAGMTQIARARFEQAWAQHEVAVAADVSVDFAASSAAHALLALRLGDPAGDAVLDTLHATGLFDSTDMPMACDLAVTLWQQLQDERLAAGLPALRATPPPVASADLGKHGHCADPALDPANDIHCTRRHAGPAAADLDAWVCGARAGS